jgi:hypothetical protein
MASVIRTANDSRLHRRLTLHLRRTLLRLQRWQKLPPETVAEIISPDVPVSQIVELSLYLGEVANRTESKDFRR